MKEPVFLLIRLVVAARGAHTIGEFFCETRAFQQWQNHQLLFSAWFVFSVCVCVCEMLSSLSCCLGW